MMFHLLLYLLSFDLCWFYVSARATNLALGGTVYGCESFVQSCCSINLKDVQSCCNNSYGSEMVNVRLMLNGLFFVSRIVIHGENDIETSGIEVAISQGPGAAITMISNNMRESYGSGVFTIRLGKVLISEINITRPGNLTLCKVEVYSVCADYTYGDECVPCGNCINSEECHKTTGACPHGCSRDWGSLYCNETSPVTTTRQESSRTTTRAIITNTQPTTTRTTTYSRGITTTPTTPTTTTTTTTLTKIPTATHLIITTPQSDAHITGTSNATNMTSTEPGNDHNECGGRTLPLILFALVSATRLLL